VGGHRWCNERFSKAGAQREAPDWFLPLALIAKDNALGPEAEQLLQQITAEGKFHASAGMGRGLAEELEGI